MSSLKSLLLLTTAGCFYDKSGDVSMSCFLYWVTLEERLSVRVLASAVDESSTALARTRTLKRSSSITQYKPHDMLPHHHS